MGDWKYDGFLGRWNYNALVLGGSYFFIVWLVRNNKTNGADNKEALNILKERYAKGEIDKKEFEEKKKDLSS